MNENFDTHAMELKVKKNCDAGWTVDGIKKALREEAKTLAERMVILEARMLELTDQIEYMEKTYGKSS